ncbi:DNA polymerase beta domain protein region [Desulfamplus magnetovallimortis]|uniref:DNA polymerase beta domain protein region n=1 Tax=Desulfamplus magnetovallimortis TaxID=1246637 RepID=A0A1W1HDP5_9BACT|nr:nucleotidyltransferase domain-containing protein [Desulfamplus magnetovallimortis]SLM30621.1 DNA polymerase beta domain protein region [Desulfamplus magnetovallimortis]
MRLNSTEKKAIKDSILKVDPCAKIYLFGSRVDDNKKGGDIDLLVFSSLNALEAKLLIKTELFKRIEEQKVDIIVSDDHEDPFVKMILEDGVQLI